MAYVITGTCCSDASCVAVCPVNCIHPAPGEPGHGTTDSLHVDPRACIDCGACADACPVDAVVPRERLPLDDPDAVAAQAWFADGPAEHPWGPPRFPRTLPDGGPRHVAVVGTGPAACYAVRELLRSTEAQVTVLERLAVPGGLVRFGVAPDHPGTRRIGEGFAAVLRAPRVRLRLGVEVGRDVSCAELAAHCDAVVYAVGAPEPRRLGVPGEDLPGSLAAGDVVGWYTGAPDRADLRVPLDTARAVVVGTGGVAVDVTRVLLADPAALARTDTSPTALAALRRSAVREVVLVARGPWPAASRGELQALLDDPRLQVVVAGGPGAQEALREAPAGTAAALLAHAPVEAYDPPGAPDGRRVVLLLGAAPVAVTGTDRADGLLVDVGGQRRHLPTGLVVTAVGSRGRAVPGLPFDPASGRVPSRDGRVVDPATGAPLPGTYVVGWAARGARGGIGANRGDAVATVDALLADAAAGLLPRPTGDTRSLARALRRPVLRRRAHAS